jgi:hypothetical protein
MLKSIECANFLWKSIGTPIKMTNKGEKTDNTRIKCTWIIHPLLVGIQKWYNHFWKNAGEGPIKVNMHQ